MELFIASTNAHKIEEFKGILEPLGYVVKSLNDLEEIMDIEETGKTFSDNAKIKAEAIAKKFNIACIADDSGFEVDALNKEPGVLSARYLGHDTSYAYKNQVILERMIGKENRVCRYVCAIALSVPGEETIIFEDIVEGTVANKAIGNHGFGYDPLFYYEPFKTTLANVSEKEKNSISHRGKACAKLVRYLHEMDI
ncbi:MAG: RdgB/HAM1 family non-canonical purine NTP pyrophosphatase [Anaerorhabdus sp.]